MPIGDKTNYYHSNYVTKQQLPPQGFGPRWPKSEVAYIVAPARIMIYKYILVIPQKKISICPV